MLVGRLGVIVVITNSIIMTVITNISMIIIIMITSITTKVIIHS